MLLEITQDYNKVHPDLFEAYSKNLLASVDNILNSSVASDKYFDLQVQFEANLSRFAAFKAYHATNAIKDAIGDPEKQRKILKKFNSYQAAEYNTASARIRSAKQWIDFNSDPVSNELYPNIKWLPSRSAFKREIHKLYYNRVWAKSDPFWINNQPGNLWNCKCDWEETDEPVSGLVEKGGDVKPHNGLEGNPAITGHIFTDNSVYIKTFPKKEIDKVNELFYSKSNLLINVNADLGELVDNVKTGLILAETEAVKIRKHVVVNHIPNPEYEINGYIADAKRIHGYKGINTGFSKALNKQGCECVIIDFNKHFDPQKPIKLEKISGNIKWRAIDFMDNKIKECYVVFGKKHVKITKENFIKNNIREILEGLMP